MFNFDINNYITNVAVTPKNMYKSLNQATVDLMWEDTTQIFTVKEQVALPFSEEYEEYEAWVDNVSDTLVNTSKVYSDFVSILFKDADHKQNYKGQYYKISLDGEHEETYICYDRMNKLTQLSSFKCVRCNNVMTWVDENKNIITMPCYLGTDISSTNNLISKDGTIPNSRMVVLIQANNYTKSIEKNQRFMFEHSTAFKVEEVNNYMQEQDTDGEVTMIRIYINYSSILPTDNIELNICDYTKNEYSISINQSDITQVNGFKGTLTATLKNKEEVADFPVQWSVSDDSVVEIDDYGNYTVVGENGKECTVTCFMEDNPNIKDTVKITVVDSYLSDKKIIILPNEITELRQNKSIDFVCSVEEEGETIVQEIACTADWEDATNYKLQETVSGYVLYNLKKSDRPLKLTFSSNGCEDVVYTIALNGII